MTVHFQHVGEAGGKRDFPRIIWTPSEGLVNFSWHDVERRLSDLDPNEFSKLEQGTTEYEAEGFQICGIPAEARSVLRYLQIGDYLMLLETIGRGASVKRTQPSGQDFGQERRGKEF